MDLDLVTSSTKSDPLIAQARNQSLNHLIHSVLLPPVSVRWNAPSHTRPSMSLSLLPLPLCPSLFVSTNTRSILPVRTRPSSLRLRNSPCCSSASPRLSLDSSSDEVSRATLIWRAVKLPIYSVALVPLTVWNLVLYCQILLTRNVNCVFSCFALLWLGNNTDWCTTSKR